MMRLSQSGRQRLPAMACDPKATATFSERRHSGAQTPTLLCSLIWLSIEPVTPSPMHQRKQVRSPTQSLTVNGGLRLCVLTLRGPGWLQPSSVCWHFSRLPLQPGSNFRRRQPAKPESFYWEPALQRRYPIGQARPLQSSSMTSPTSSTSAPASCGAPSAAFRDRRIEALEPTKLRVAFVDASALRPHGRLSRPDLHALDRRAAACRSRCTARRASRR